MWQTPPAGKLSPTTHIEEQWEEHPPPSHTYVEARRRRPASQKQQQQQKTDTLEPWYSYTHWFPMASGHVMKDGGPEPPPPRMQPAMMMFSSKYWSRRGMSLDSAMFDHRNQNLPQQKHTGGQMVREGPSVLLFCPDPSSPPWMWSFLSSFYDVVLQVFLNDEDLVKHAAGI